jgi:hypothetical protein
MHDVAVVGGQEQLGLLAWEVNTLIS